jgi:hypothetical protein
MTASDYKMPSRLKFYVHATDTGRERPVVLRLKGKGKAIP